MEMTGTGGGDALLVRTLELRERSGRPPGRACRPRRGAVAPRARPGLTGRRPPLLLILLSSPFQLGLPDPAPAGGTERNGAAGPPRHQQLASLSPRRGEKSDTPAHGRRNATSRAAPLSTASLNNPPPSPLARATRRKKPLRPGVPAGRAGQRPRPAGRTEIGCGKEAVGAGLIRPALGALHTLAHASSG